MPQGRDTAVDYQPQAIKNTCIQSKSAAWTFFLSEMIAKH